MTPETIHSRVCEVPFIAEMDKGLGGRVAQTFEKVGKTEVIESGTMIFQKGDTHSDDAYIILEGELSVLKGDAPEIIAVAPELIGEMGQFNPSKLRTATVTASTRLEVLRFQWAEWKDAARTYLTTDELEKVVAALQDYAWRHFTQ